MKFTDLFIKRPVLSIVVSLVIVIAGLQSIRSLSVRQYPRSDIAVVQVSTGARIFGKLQHVSPLQPRVVAPIHRWSGRLAILCTLPVAFHCIFILGFSTYNTRVLAHSIVGSFVYGVIVVKLLMVHSRKHPGWSLPLAGGTLFAVLVTLWATSAAWYFTNVRFGF